MTNAQQHADFIIEHVLGAWFVEVIERCDDVPEGCKDWDAYGRGFLHYGHAVAYLKRFAKNSPDKSTCWVLYEFSGRWYVAIRRAK